MKTVILNKLNNIVVRNDCDMSSFKGVKVAKHRDIHGNEYELKADEEKYCLVQTIGDISIFASEEYLLSVLLRDSIEDVESGVIYDHGYPEGRLIPSNHHEMCQEEFLMHVKDDFNEKIENVIGQYF